MNIDDHTYKELDKNKFPFVKYGHLMIITVLALTILILSSLKIDNKSILNHVVLYYLNNN